MTEWQDQGTLLVENIGSLFTGITGEDIVRDTSLYVENGCVAAVGGPARSADTIIDAAGLDMIPGLVDGHVHPAFGDWTPVHHATGWLRSYVHGGVTTAISAGELHVPGLDLNALDVDTVKALARTVRRTTARMDFTGRTRVVAGTLLVVPGLSESDFDEMAEAGVSHVKFIFYPWDRLGDGEAQRYVTWARQRGMTSKIHAGGVSRSGVSRIADADVVCSVAPDVIAHISGGPIPMRDDDIARVVQDLPNAALEVCSSMNYRATRLVVEELTHGRALHRLTMGTDTPSGTGILPRGMLRNMTFLASICGMSPDEVVAVATSNTARAHGLDTGVLEVGRPADFLLAGPIGGSDAGDLFECLSIGDLPGISAVARDGVPQFVGRSEQTPPPRAVARLVRSNGLSP